MKKLFFTFAMLICMFSFSLTVNAAKPPKPGFYLTSHAELPDIGKVTVTTYNNHYRPDHGVATALWIENYNGTGYVAIYLNAKGKVKRVSSGADISKKDAQNLTEKIYKASMK